MAATARSRRSIDSCGNDVDSLTCQRRNRRPVAAHAAKAIAHPQHLLQA